jgi:predicted nucleic acid-binding Zn ribbon protein
MTGCSEMKLGEIYVCQSCGLELQVVKACADQEEGACACTEAIVCCGQPMVAKK